MVLFQLATAKPMFIGPSNEGHRSSGDTFCVSVCCLTGTINSLLIRTHGVKGHLGCAVFKDWYNRLCTKWFLVFIVF